MSKLLSILLIGILLTGGNPINELKVNNPPTTEEAGNLNQSDQEFEVFFNSKGIVSYRDDDYRRAKGPELPFKITSKRTGSFEFGGKQINLKIEEGWLVGFDKGEWGGNLYWFNEKGTEYERITRGNIKNLFKIGNEIYVTEGLAHLSIARGKLFKVFKNDNKWAIEEKVDLAYSPYAATLTNDAEFLIVTSEGLIKIDKNFKIQQLIIDGFWGGFLYPNSILIEGQNIYIGMRGGIFKTQLDDINEQQWLTKSK